MSASGLQIELRPAIVVTVSPPGEERWGFYQFPNLWQGRDGEFYVAVNVGADSIAGRHEPTQLFISRDAGQSWARIDEQQARKPPEIVTLPDGGQVMFGYATSPSHFDPPSPEVQRSLLLPDDLGLAPVADPVRDGYRVNEYLFYRYADISQDLRRFPLASRPGPDAPWEAGSGTIEMPDLLLGALIRAMWWDDEGKEVWVERPAQLSIPVPKQVVVLPDGTLLWAHASQHPALTSKRFDRVACLASEDGGFTWVVRGIIADDPGAATWGYGAGEQSLARMPNGDLLCVMRTRMSCEAEDAHYLAAAWSADGGHTWSAPFCLAEFCVTPHLLTLENGLAALVYGRPGVHIRASADSGETWCESVPLVGPPEAELLAQSLEEWWAVLFDHSCANTTVVVTGPDRFLVAYSDFAYTGEDDKIHKAIKVRDVVVRRADENG